MVTAMDSILSEQAMAAAAAPASSASSVLQPLRRPDTYDIVDSCYCRPSAFNLRCGGTERRTGVDAAGGNWLTATCLDAGAEADVVSSLFVILLCDTHAIATEMD